MSRFDFLKLICFPFFIHNKKPIDKKISFCLDNFDYQIIKTVFNNAKTSNGCIFGQKNIELDKTIAYNLLFALSQGLELSKHAK